MWHRHRRPQSINTLIINAYKRAVSAEPYFIFFFLILLILGDSIDSESSSIISNGSSVADLEDIGPTNEAFGQESRPDVTNPPIDLENEQKRMVDILEAQSAKLGAAFREIKATTNYFLNATQGQQGAEIRNPETGRRVKLENGDFVRLNGWIESSMDILKQYLLLDNMNIAVNGPEEGAETRDQNGSDLNKGLFIIGIEGYTVLMEEVELLKSAANGKAAPLSNEVHLAEELHRFLNWGSYIGIEEGQLAILASHPLYRDIQDVLERVIVTLITICEECFLKESTFVTSSPAGKFPLPFMVYNSCLELIVKQLGTERDSLRGLNKPKGF